MFHLLNIYGHLGLKSTEKNTISLISVFYLLI